MHSIDTKLLLKKRKLKRYLKKQKKRMKELRKALRFYADWYNWVESPPNGGTSTFTDWDRGTIARKALRLPPPGNETEPRTPPSEPGVLSTGGAEQMEQMRKNLLKRLNK